MPDSPSLRVATKFLCEALGRREVTGLGVAAVCAIAVSGLGASAPVALKFVVEGLSGDGAAGIGLADAQSIVWWFAAYVGAMLGARLAVEARSIFFGEAEQAIIRNLSRNAFAHVVAQPMKQHFGRSTGEIVQTLENGLQGYRLVLQHGLLTLVPGLVEIALIALLVLHLFDAAFLGVFAICSAGYSLVFFDGARRMLQTSRDVSSARIKANARLSDGLMNVETIKAYSGEVRFTGLYDGALAETQGRWRRFYRARLANGVMVAAVFTAGLGTILWLAAGRVQQGLMSVGDLVLINAWMLQVVRPLELLGYGFRDIGQSAAFIERLQAVLREPVEPGLGSENVSFHRHGGPVPINLHNVTFAYDGGNVVLEDVSIRIESGQFVALIGPSGSGKSTLIRLLMKFHEPSSGRIEFDGHLLSAIPASFVREQVAFVSQEAGLINDSAAFNVVFPSLDVDEARVHEVLARVGLDDLLERSPDAPGTPVGESGVRLSGGEKQRLAVARALLRKPRLVLADEPTSSLDTVSEAAVFRALCAVAASGATMIVATHRLAAITGADLIVVLSGGRIVESGQHEGLLKAGGTYAAMWGARNALPK